MILIALGANLPGPLGLPPQTLAGACRALEDKGVKILAASRLWRSAPVPISDQPWYYNAVVRVETALPPDALLGTLHDIEASFGRTRHARNEARILDLDLIDYDGMICDIAEGMILPHPRLRARAFVLMPLRDVAPEWSDPVTGESVAALIAALPPQEIIAGEALV